MIFDHISLPVSDHAASLAFYQAALAPLGIKVVMEYGEWTAMGIEAPQFWFGEDRSGGVDATLHIAFCAKSRADVRAFHKAAIAAGGQDNGGPGVRPQYHPNYYGAFILDPDGHNIEAVCHQPEVE